MSIKKGSIVKYNGGWYSVKTVFKNTANLSTVFGSTPIIKGVLKENLKEDADTFYKHWQKSETYMCM